METLQDVPLLTALDLYNSGNAPSYEDARPIIEALPLTLRELDLGVAFVKTTEDLQLICNLLPQLQSLGFSVWDDRDEVVGSRLTVLTTLSALTDLDLGLAVKPSENLLEHVGKLTSLRSLGIDGCSGGAALPNSCLRHLSNLTRLSCLSASHNGFTDAGTSYLTHLTCLKMLSL